METMTMTAWFISSPEWKTVCREWYHKVSLLFRLFRSRFSTVLGLALFLPLLGTPSIAQQNAQEKLLFDQLNDSRKQAGLEPLEWDEHLASAARQHSQLMASKNQLEHVLPGEAEVGERLAATGIRFNRSGENVAYDSDLDDFTQSWLKSPPHKENMLSPNYNSVGIGVAKTDDGLFYATQDFAHSLAHLSESQAEDLATAAFNELRKSNGHAAVERISDSHVHDLACSMAQRGKLDPRSALKIGGVVEAVVYNNSHPENLPDSAHKVAERDRYTKLAVGACFTSDQPQNPGGTFYVVMAFFQ
jgi:hypothetical protein